MSLYRPWPILLAFLPPEVADPFRELPGESLPGALSEIADMADEVGAKLLLEVSGTRTSLDPTTLAASMYLHNHDEFAEAHRRRVCGPMVRLRVFASNRPFDSWSRDSVAENLEQMPSVLGVEHWTAGTLDVFTVRRAGPTVVAALVIDGRPSVMRAPRLAIDSIVIDAAARRLDVVCEETSMVDVYRRMFARRLCGSDEAFDGCAVHLRSLAELDAFVPAPPIAVVRVAGVEPRANRDSAHHPRDLASATLEVTTTSGRRRSAVLVPPHDIRTDAPLDLAVRRMMNELELVRSGA